jgi:thymidylate synthase (FAD)
MRVSLLHNTPLWVNAHGARTCWDSGGKSDTEAHIEQWSTDGGWLLMGDISQEDFDAQWGSSGDMPECGPRDAELIDRVGNKFRHASILEHVSYNFHIEGVSRALLQELARHRIASLSVKSTRYTLKELKDEVSFITNENNDVNPDRAEKYLVFTRDWAVDYMSCLALENLRITLQKGISNDKAKYCLPEAYKTELTWTINMRSLQNFLSLRSDKSALWEIRDLAHSVYLALPEEHRYLFTDQLKIREVEIT